MLISGGRTIGKLGLSLSGRAGNITKITAAWRHTVLLKPSYPGQLNFKAAIRK